MLLRLSFLLGGASAVRIAFVGDSQAYGFFRGDPALRTQPEYDTVTYGDRQVQWCYPNGDRSEDAPVRTLQRLLGDDHEVLDYTINGRSVRLSTSFAGGENASYMSPNNREFECLTTGTNMLCTIPGAGRAACNYSYVPARDPNDVRHGAGPPYDAVISFLGTMDGVLWDQASCPLPEAGSGAVEYSDAAFNNCAFVRDYLALIRRLRALPSPNADGPTVFIVIPPPVLSTVGGANPVVMNFVLPVIIPRIAEAAGVRVIDVFGSFGGHEIPDSGPTPCVQGPPEDANQTACSFMCNATFGSCDSMHSTDAGYRHTGEFIHGEISSWIGSRSTVRKSAAHGEYSTAKGALQPH